MPWIRTVLLLDLTGSIPPTNSFRNIKIELAILLKRIENLLLGGAFIREYPAKPP